MGEEEESERERGGGCSGREVESKGREESRGWEEKEEKGEGDRRRGLGEEINTRKK